MTGTRCVLASLAGGGFPFDVIVVGAGMFGAYCAEKLYRLGAYSGLRVLVLDAGGDAASRCTSRTCRNVWAGPWVAPGTTGRGKTVQACRTWCGACRGSAMNPRRGSAHCLGGRSIFWGGWSPRLTETDLRQLRLAEEGSTTEPGGYDRTEIEIGTVPSCDYMLATSFHDDLLAALQKAVGDVPDLRTVEEAPLAVVGSPPASGLFAYDKFSSAPFLIDAVRN